MKRYGVEIPIAGSIYVEVEAENEEDAIEAALSRPFTDEEIQGMQWESFEALCEGNILHVPLNEATAAEVKE